MYNILLKVVKKFCFVIAVFSQQILSLSQYLVIQGDRFCHIVRKEARLSLGLDWVWRNERIRVRFPRGTWWLFQISIFWRTHSHRTAPLRSEPIDPHTKLSSYPLICTSILFFIDINKKTLKNSLKDFSWNVHIGYASLRHTSVTSTRRFAKVPFRQCVILLKWPLLFSRRKCKTLLWEGELFWLNEAFAKWRFGEQRVTVTLVWQSDGYPSYRILFKSYFQNIIQKVNGQKFVYRFVQFPDNFSPSQIEVSDVPSVPGPEALTYNSPSNLIENSKKRPLVGASFSGKQSPKKRARVNQRPANALDLTTQNTNSDLNLIDLINLANSGSATISELGQETSQGGTSQTGTDTQIGLYQLLALQYLAELNKTDAQNALANPNSSLNSQIGSDPLGSDGEIASVSSGSPEVKIRSRSISPYQAEPQEEPLDLSQPKRLKLSITEN